MLEQGEYSGQQQPGADGTSKNLCRQAALQAALAIARLMLRTTCAAVNAALQANARTDLHVTVLQQRKHTIECVKLQRNIENSVGA
jgi:hypothetical protein